MPFDNLLVCAIAYIKKSAITVIIGRMVVSNEAGQAKSVSDHLQTDHVELCVSPDRILEVVTQPTQIYDERFADSLSD